MDATPSQTVGPFFEIGMRWLDAERLVDPTRPGAIRVEGQITDGTGDPVPDAVVEIFQADDRGRFHPATEGDWTGFGRCLSDALGRYGFVTVKPGSVEDRAAPHLDVSVFARGLMQRLVTRCYFGDEEEANRGDALLSQIGPERASTLIAPLHDRTYRFDIVLQGDKETAFLAW